MAYEYINVSPDGSCAVVYETASSLMDTINGSRPLYISVCIAVREYPLALRVLQCHPR